MMVAEFIDGTRIDAQCPVMQPWFYIAELLPEVDK